MIGHRFPVEIHATVASVILPEDEVKLSEPTRDWGSWFTLTAMDETRKRIAARLRNLDDVWWSRVRAVCEARGIPLHTDTHAVYRVAEQLAAERFVAADCLEHLHMNLSVARVEAATAKCRWHVSDAFESGNFDFEETSEDPQSWESTSKLLRPRLLAALRGLGVKIPSPQSDTLPKHKLFVTLLTALEVEPAPVSLCPAPPTPHPFAHPQLVQAVAALDLRSHAHARRQTSTFLFRLIKGRLNNPGEMHRTTNEQLRAACVALDLVPEQDAPTLKRLRAVKLLGVAFGLLIPPPAPMPSRGHLDSLGHSTLVDVAVLLDLLPPKTRTDETAQQLRNRIDARLVQLTSAAPDDPKNVPQRAGPSRDDLLQLVRDFRHLINPGFAASSAERSATLVNMQARVRRWAEEMA